MVTLVCMRESAIDWIRAHTFRTHNFVLVNNKFEAAAEHDGSNSSNQPPAADANDRRVCLYEYFYACTAIEKNREKYGHSESGKVLRNIQFENRFNNNRYYKSKVITHNQAKGRPPKNRIHVYR